MTKQDILTSLQKEFMQCLFADTWFRRYFYLTGGTALSAFYYQHRYSEDLDFFSHDVELISIPKLMDEVGKRLKVKVEHTQTTPYLRRFLIDKDLKVDVAADVNYRVGSPQLIGNYMIDNLKNIAMNKVVAILGRLEAKDYVDLYWILKKEKYDIFELFELGKNKDGGLEPFIWAALIADVERLSLLPRMIQPLDLNALKKFFLKLRDQILDQIKPH